MSAFTQRNFAAGEIGPPLYSRVDTVKYATGARTLRNMIVMRHGGVTNRGGTGFIASVKIPSKTGRLIPFIFDAAQAYVLEFGHLYFRVINNGAYQLEAAKTITGITKANPAVVTSAAHGFSNGDEVVIAAVVGMTQLNGRNFKVANKTANTFELTDLHGTNINSTGYTTYASGGTASRVYTLASIYQDVDLPDVTFAQSADILEMAHPVRGPQRVARTTSTTWNPAFVPTFGIPAPTAMAVSGAAAVGNYTDVIYEVIDVSDATGEEGTAKLPFPNSYAKPTVANPHTVTWTSSGLAVGCTSYIYRSFLGVFGLVGTSANGLTGGTFFDDGSGPIDFTQRPPLVDVSVAFQNSPDFEAAVTYFQQRFWRAGGPSHPETVIASRVALYYNYLSHFTQPDNDPLKFVLNSKTVQNIKHMIDVGRLLIFTSTGEWTVDGNQNGVITPSSIFAKQHSNFGCNSLPPILINASILFVQARGSIVRDIAYDFRINGYSGNDLTIYSPHLVDGHTLSAWTHQLVPHSIVWSVRDDGTLLGLTYLKEQEIIGWHRHDFGAGFVEGVCSVPEGTEDAVYVIVRRTVNGLTERYVERMATRHLSNIVDLNLTECSLSYDGRNAAATTMTISGGTTWAYNETMTLTASAGFFTAADVGNIINLTGADGTLIRFTITGYTSTTVVTGHPQKTVPAGMHSVATAVWSKAVSVVSGLWHLEGQYVSVFADGFVVASPNNAKYDKIAVTNGTVTLDRPYAVIHVGLPFISDVETLDIDTAQGETVADKFKLITAVDIRVQDSRGIWAGPKPPTSDTVDPLENLYELKVRSTEGYDSPVDLSNEVVNIDIKSEWNSNGRVFIRQVDPLPLTILAITPSGLVPFKGG